MAITQGGMQEIKSTTAARIGSGISQTDAFEGLLAKYSADTDWKTGKGTVVKTSANTDRYAGVIQNVSTTSVNPVTLDDNATPPGGSGTCVLATSGNVLLRFDGNITNSEFGQAVIPSTTAGQATASSSPGTNPIVGYIISTAASGNTQIDSKDVALVRLIPV